MQKLLIIALLIFMVANSLCSKFEESPSEGDLIELNEENWELMLKGEWMVEFYAPWCPACKSLAPTWERFATAAYVQLVNVAKIDVTKSPSLSGRFFVTALPTIYHVKDGDFRQYRGSRDDNAFMSYIKNQQWKDTAKISSWKKPDTIHMSILSYFFKLSHTLKDFNTRLQEEHGLPTWGSYALFAIGTIFVGAALGLLLVCVVDFLYPPKKSQRQSFSESKNKSYNAVEDVVNDELEDDDDDEDGDDAAAAAAAAADSENQNYDDDNDDDEDDENENDNAEDGRSTSEGEKISQSDSDQSESEKRTTIKQNEESIEKQKFEEKSSPGEVRKRRSRKAD